MRTKFYSLMLFFLFCNSVYANDWGIATPWDEPIAQPPEIKPFELPTLKGEAPHYNTPTPALKPAPKIDPDTIFQTVLNCYPEKSKFKLDLNLVVGMRTNLDEYNSDDWPEISEHYVGIVGKSRSTLLQSNLARGNGNTNVEPPQQRLSLPLPKHWLTETTLTD